MSSSVIAWVVVAEPFIVSSSLSTVALANRALDQVRADEALVKLRMEESLEPCERDVLSLPKREFVQKRGMVGAGRDKRSILQENELVLPGPNMTLI